MKLVVKKILSVAVVLAVAAGSANAECTKTPKEITETLVELRVAQLNGQKVEEVSRGLLECLEYFQSAAIDNDSIVLASQMASVAEEINSVKN